MSNSTGSEHAKISKAGSAEGSPQSVHTRRIFTNEDLLRLLDRTEIKNTPQMWDVGVPMVGDRPALDDMLVKSGRTHKERVTLQIALEQDGDLLTVNISNRHLSRSALDVRSFGVPMVTEMPDSSPFSEFADSDLYSFMKLSIGKDGTVRLDAVIDETQELTTILDISNDPGSPDHVMAINFAERMLAVPFFDGVFRAPLGGVVQQ